MSTLPHMANHPHLNNAPIAEAVVEIRVRRSGPVDEESYAAFTSRLKASLPKSQNIRFLMARLHFENENEIKNDLENSRVGVRLDSEDGKWVVQAKNDGLTVSRMPPYESWGPLIDKVKDIWPLYVEVFRPETVVRLGVRYINRIPLPGTDHVDLDSVLTGGPKIPPKLPQALSQFLTRVVLPMADEGITLVVTQELQPQPADLGAPLGNVLVDIDASCECGLAVDSQVIWERLIALRNAKNMAFFASVTEPTWKRFV